MIEYERRYRISNEDFERLQSSSEISWSTRSRVVDVTFGPSGSESMQIDGWVIRLRKNGANVALQYKAPANAEWTAWEEISISVDKASTAIKFLHAIGMKTGLLLDRTRSIGVWGHYTISLDEFALLGKFVEIEINTDLTLADMPNFDRFIEFFSLQSASECEPYGQQMLSRIKSEPELAEQVSSYLKSIE